MNIPNNLRVASEASMEDRAIVMEERQVGDATQVALLAVKRDIYRAIADRIVTDTERALRLCRAVDALRVERAACEAARSAA